jgi:hypothetical protein
MTDIELTRLAVEIVGIQRRVTGLPRGESYGWSPMSVAGKFRSWFEIIERDSETAPKEVRDELQNWKGYFAQVQPTCFLDDLTVKNVMIDAGELKGIVDLDFVCYGDPLYWLSLAEVTSILDVGARGFFYGDELRRLWKMTPIESSVCSLYNVIQAWFFLSKDEFIQPLRDWADSRFVKAKFGR